MLFQLEDPMSFGAARGNEPFEAAFLSLRDVADDFLRVPNPHADKFFLKTPACFTARQLYIRWRFPGSDPLFLFVPRH